MGSYDDIIGLPHHVSERHPQMPIADRAAQFAPFAALTGYESEVKEAARLTEQKAELSEDQRAVLDEQLNQLESCLPQRPETLFTYFQPDNRKDGGAYVTISGTLKKLDRLERKIILTDGTTIPVENLIQLDRKIHNQYELQA